MADSDCVTFLQWALPRLDLRWRGFRRVRGQVCKRLRRRMAALGLEDFDAYRRHLEAEPAEWRALDARCYITISRFYRDRGVFDALRRRVLPEIAARAAGEGRPAQCWSAGCASGEEPYTLRIIWDEEIAPLFPGAGLEITATDAGGAVLERARRGCYAASSLRDMPDELRTAGFERKNDEMCLRAAYRQGIEFRREDIRDSAPAGPFDLILCRNLAFTYFANGLQSRVLSQIARRLRPGGRLVIGAHERLPHGEPAFAEDGMTEILRYCSDGSS